MADGRVAYMGNTGNALEFFDCCGYKCPINCNPAEFFLNMLASVPGKERESEKRIEVSRH